MAFIISLIAISSLIFLINLLLFFLFPKFTKKPNKSNNYLNISVIIAFKDEQKNLANLFSFLEALDYPKDKFEVVLIDDLSSDNSYQKVVELSHNVKNYRVLKAENKKFPGKKGALDEGISKARYAHILITDADCMPAKNWLMGYSEKFSSGFDMLFGLAPFRLSKGLINKISCFDNLRSSILTFVFAKLGLPYSAAARNFGFTHSAYQKLKGFSKTLETPGGDDDLLIREAVKNNLKIGIVDFAESYVFSESKYSLVELLNQKARHTKTSLHYLPMHQLILGMWHTSNILIVFGLLLSPLNFYFSIPFVIKTISDFIIVFGSQKKHRYTFKFLEIPFLQAAYEILLIVNFLSSFKKSISWKNDI